MKKMIVVLISILLLACDAYYLDAPLEQASGSYFGDPRDPLPKGIIQVTVSSGQYAFFNWNEPLNGCSDFKVVLSSGDYSNILSFDVKNQPVGTYTTRLPNGIDLTKLGSLSLEVSGCNSGNKEIDLYYEPDLDNGSNSYTYTGGLNKCKHEFSSTATNMSLTANLNNREIKGFLMLGTPYRVIVEYKYRDIMGNKMITGSSFEDLSPNASNDLMRWNDAGILLNNYMSSFEITLRIYLNDRNKPCKLSIPARSEEWNANGTCTNYVEYKFSGYATNGYFNFSKGTLVN